jgi:hypothetical protein
MRPLSDNVKNMEQHQPDQLSKPVAVPNEAPADDDGLAREVSTAQGLRHRFAELSPHLSRYAEFSAACACSSVYPTCIGAATASIVVPMVFGERGQERDQNS